MVPNVKGLVNLYIIYAYKCIYNDCRAFFFFFSSNNGYPVVVQSSRYFLPFLMKNIRLPPTIYCNAGINNIC